MRLKIIAALAFAALALLTVGCGAGHVISPSPQPGLALRGVVHGGQQAVADAHVYLFAANTTGYGGKGIPASTSNASISLLNAASTGYSDSIGAYVLSDSGGNFAITGDYTCTPGQQVYLYTLGGNPGGGTNSWAGFLAVLGNCPATGDFSSTVPFVYVDELTTIAAAYAMAPFATDATHVSSSGTSLALTGIQNAFANAANLVDISTGSARTTTHAGNGTVPTQTINTLGNILGSCINSADRTDGSMGPLPSESCSNLFNQFYSNGAQGNNANDTATEAIYIAHNPGYGTGILFGLPSANPPFGNALTTQPNDFSLCILFTGSDINGPWGIAVDQQGDIWFANDSSVGELSSLGVPLDGGTAFSTSTYGNQGIAIDLSGKVWIDNSNNGGPGGSVIVLSSNGTPTSFSPITQNGMQSPVATAIDGNGNAWIVDSGSSAIYKVSTSTGQVLSGSNGFQPGGLGGPQSIAIDAAQNVWIANYGANDVVELDNMGNSLSGPSGYDSGQGGLSQSFGIALDQASNAWVTDTYPFGITILNNTGGLMTSSAYAPTSLHSYPFTIAVDGAGIAWVCQQAFNGVVGINSSGVTVSGSNGYQSGSNLEATRGIALDGSGDVWLTSEFDSSLNYSSVIAEYIGAAAPVVTPIAASLLAPYSTPASKP